MTGSVSPMVADPVRPLGEPIGVQPQIFRPLARSAPPGRAASLSHGAVVEASILARLLGIRLLRLDAHIDMVPVESDRQVGPAERYSTAPVIELTAAPVVPNTSSTSSDTLADAAELLEHATRTLGDVRRERVARVR
jgi:hypothetical protein